MRPLGLYLHIPFCKAKCAYCDFCSVSGTGDEDMRRYVDALLLQMEDYSKAAKNYSVDTIFISPAEIAKNNEDPQLIARELSEILDVDYDKILSMTKNTDRWYEVVKRKVEPDVSEKVRAFKKEKKLVGVKMGKLIHDYANGMDSSPVLAEPEAVKGYGNSVTLEEDVTDTAQANKILLALCDSVASRMRADGRLCSCVTVTIRGNDFRNKSHQRKLPEPTDVTAVVFALSKTLFSELWDGYTPLRLLGVTLGDVSDNETVQLSMFQDDQKDRARKLDQTVDQLRSKFGVTAISRGSVTDATKRVGRKYKAQLEEDKPK